MDKTLLAKDTTQVNKRDPSVVEGSIWEICLRAVAVGGPAQHM